MLEDCKMSMHVSQLRAVPVGLYNYYVYVVDASDASGDTTLIDNFFDRFAQQSEVSAVIVRGPENLSFELYKFLQKHAGENFSRIEDLFHNVTCLVVSEGALQTTRQPVYVLPLILKGGSREWLSEFLDSLLGGLIDAMRRGQVESLVRSFGSVQLPLAEISGGMFVSTLRWINSALELKLNIAGIGVNLNEKISRLIGPEARPL
jgi:hypothetical protein